MTQTRNERDPETHFNRALESYADGDLHAAMNSFKKALVYGMPPESTSHMIKLSGEFSERELWKESEECLLDILRVDPENREALKMLDSLHTEPARFYGIKPHFDEAGIEEIKRRSVVSSVPRIQLFIELTNRCNGRCTTCLHSSMKREQGVMDFDLFRKIVDESLGSLYLEMVHLYGVGEVYMIPGVMKYFDYALERYSERGIRTCLITNGERITELPADLSVVDISFNAGKKETYERITGISFDRTRDNILRLQRDGQLDEKVNIHMLVFDDNAEEIDEFKRLFAYTGAELVLAYKYDNQRGEIEDKTVARHKTGNGASGARIPCHYVRDVLNIAWNGDVILCPHDFDGEVNYGNANDQALAEIWYGSLHKKMLSDHAACSFQGLCAKCNFNLPIDGKNVVVSKDERIALRKKHASGAWKGLARCENPESCEILKRYLDNIDEIEQEQERLVAICSTDYRFYGIDTVMDESSHTHCPGLRRLRENLKNTRVCWKAPTFGPSGYAFAARGYITGLADLGTHVCAQPLLGDCKTEYDGYGEQDA